MTESLLAAIDDALVARADAERQYESAVLAAHAAGISAYAIGKHIGKAPHTISYQIRRFRERAR